MNSHDLPPAISSTLTSALLAVCGGYAVGCLNAAFYLVRWRTGHDIRSMGSGNAGARNAGRMLGHAGFLLVFLSDAAKGAIAVGVARQMGLGPLELAAVVLAVVVGHVWPVQLGFRGGKGIAPSLGALLVYDARILLLLVAVFLIVFAVLRRFTASGLLAFAFCPLTLLAFQIPKASAVGAASLAAIVWITHRDNVREELQQRRQSVSSMRSDSASATEVKK